MPTPGELRHAGLGVLAGVAVCGVVHALVKSLRARAEAPVAAAGSSPAAVVTLGGKVVAEGHEEAKTSAAADDTDGVDIYKEQYSRNRLLFGDDGQQRVHDAFVIIVGVGGVGSHAAHMFARCGVEKLRLIDFDQVTLSSLNRHAFATHADVGTTKVAAGARHIKAFAPRCSVDARPVMFTKDSADELLAGSPSYVIDCIDDADTKLELLVYCKEHGINVISAMSAGAKADPTRIHIANISDAIKDPLARKIRFLIRKDGRLGKDYDIPVVYSSEKPLMKLQHLSQGHIDTPQEFGAVENFRSGVLPVLGTLPAIFGNAIASHVVCAIGGKPLTPCPVQKLSDKRMQKLLQSAGGREKRVFKAKGELDLTQDELEFAVRFVWRYRSPMSKVGLLQGKHRLVTRWDTSKPLTLTNLVLASKTEAQDLLENGWANIDPEVVAEVNAKLAEVAELHARS